MEAEKAGLKIPQRRTNWVPKPENKSEIHQTKSGRKEERNRIPFFLLTYHAIDIQLAGRRSTLLKVFKAVKFAEICEIYNIQGNHDKYIHSHMNTEEARE